MNQPKEVRASQLVAKLALLWIALLVLPFTERTLLGAKTYYFLYIGLALVFVMYGLTIRSIFAFLQHTRREPVYVWIAFLAWSVFICSILAVFAIEYDLLPHTPEASMTKSRPLIDYLYFEIITFTTVGYGDIVPRSAPGKLSSGRDALAKAGASRFGAVAIHALDTVGNSIAPLTMIQFLRSQFGVQILLHEGGPTLFGQFLAAEAVDELFLTLSPQIAGRAARTNRPGIVQGVEFAPNSAPCGSSRWRDGA